MAAVLLALLSIVTWSTLALLGTRISELPPFLTVGVALVVGGLVGLVRVREWRVPWPTFAVGLGGLFGYHALLFAAFALAPAVEVNLLNYLWPLLLVLLSPVVLPGLRLGPRHLAGALLGLAGAALLVSGGKLGLEVAYLPGYLLAAAAALVWACYSLLTKRLPPFPSGAVGGFCMASGLLSLAFYGAGLVLVPDAPLPSLDLHDGLTLVLLGLGPMGGAFFAWDAALKRGDPRVIGALAYLAPLLSTMNLVLFGGKPLSPTATLAMALIVAGAVLGSLDAIGPNRPRSALRRPQQCS